MVVFPQVATNGTPHAGFRVATSPQGFDFNDRSKWVDVPGVPVLDEHELTNESGEVTGVVDSKFLADVARNNNERFRRTGDATPLTRGHTSDDPNAPDPPVIGFAIGYRVAPWRNGRNALFADFKVMKRYEHEIDNSRRSVELWVSKREVDPIAVLKGTTPERDLGVILRNARISAITPGSLRRGVSPANPSDGPQVLKYHQRRGTVIRYGIAGNPVRYRGEDCAMYPGSGPMQYDDADMDTQDPPDDEGEGGGDDPVVAQVLQSKAFKQAIQEAVMSALEGLEGGGAGGEPGMGAGTGTMPGGSPDGMGAGGMAGAGNAPPPDEEAAMFHGRPPVRFEDDGMGGNPTQYSQGAFPGQNNVNQPQFVSHRSVNPSSPAKGKKKMQRQPPTNGTPAAENGEVVRLRRTVAHLVQKNARSEANALVTTLENEGILFGNTPQAHAAGKQKDADFLASLDDEARATFVNQVIRQRYARRQTGGIPQQGQGGPFAAYNAPAGGVAQYARQPEGQQAGDDWEPGTPEEVAEVVRYATRNKITDINEAVKKYSREAQQHQNGRARR